MTFLAKTILSHYCQDVISSQFELEIQRNPNKTPGDIYRYWQTDSKVLWRGKSQNINTI